MNKFESFLFAWKKPFIRDQDLIPLIPQDTRRYDTVKNAFKKEILLPIRRGLYLIGKPYKAGRYDPFEIASVIYGPSYLSLESALSFHEWIPEAVYTTTSVSAKRSKTFGTPIGVFCFLHTPTTHFFLNVQRVENKDENNKTSSFLIAEPWKAIADAIYCYRRGWKSIRDLSNDLRIEMKTLEHSDLKALLHIANAYESTRVQKTLQAFFQELS